ncbi:MAG: RNA polymerase sigma factor [Acidimicrobiales bacterium]
MSCGLPCRSLRSAPDGGRASIASKTGCVRGWHFCGFDRWRRDKRRRIDSPRRETGPPPTCDNGCRRVEDTGEADLPISSPGSGRGLRAWDFLIWAWYILSMATADTERPIFYFCKPCGAVHLMAMVRGRTTVDLIRESALGDEQAISELVQETAPDFLAFVAKRSSCDPEYIVNEVLANVLRRLPELDLPSETEFRAYVYRSLRNRLADEARRSTPVTVPIDAMADSTAPTVEFEGEVVRRLSLSSLLDRLTPAQRAVISSRFLHGLSLEETAVRVGKPVRSVKALQNRGLRSLRLAAGAVVVVILLVLGLLVVRDRVDTDLQPVDTNGGLVDDSRTDGDSSREGGDATSTDRTDDDVDLRTDASTTTVAVDNGGGEAPQVGGPVGAVPGMGAEAVRAGASGVPAGAAPATPAGGGGSGDPGAGEAVSGSPATAASPTPTAAPAPAPTTTAAPGAPRCVSLEGPQTVSEGTTSSYRLLFDTASGSERIVRINVEPGSAAWVGSPSGVDNQDIMWGGYYTTWLTAPLLPPVQTGTVYNRVLVPGNGLLGLLSSDHPMVGPADATWDYSILSGGVVQQSPWVDVRVPAGALRSDPIEIKAYAEKVTIDMHGNHTGYDEVGERFGLASSGCSTSVVVANTSTQVFINNNF